ncbi:MAG: endonuclease V [Desulfobacteraceae bacterium]|nr:endonuclease V [Desulfobacteraceae bacterium]
MKAALDVHYKESTGVAACVVFRDWTDGRPADVVTAQVCGVGPYRPGRFYERELDCLTAVLGKTGIRFDTIVIDGYVHLNNETGRGLGAHLRDALSYFPVIVGVAKNPLKTADNFVIICRGKSKKPLFVSAAGCRPEQAGLWIKSMHGPHRIPTLLRIADQTGKDPLK